MAGPKEMAVADSDDEGSGAGDAAAAVPRPEHRGARSLTTLGSPIKSASGATISLGRRPTKRAVTSAARRRAPRGPQGRRLMPRPAGPPRRLVTGVRSFRAAVFRNRPTNCIWRRGRRPWDKVMLAERAYAEGAQL